MSNNNIGPFIINLDDTKLSSNEKNLIKHDLIGGIILFSHNFVSYINILLNRVRHEKKRERKENLLFLSLIGSVIVVTGIIASL